ncbi:hypothetical protein B0H34DRAFT_802378 [Crassisporium funariophilum]|nr:hypothetical protein B0H34DRAFT_802378 [Crassisporium funariophilum]
MDSWELSWEDAQLQEIAHDPALIEAFQNLKYANVALLTLLVYDHCLTFNLEVLLTLPCKYRSTELLTMPDEAYLDTAMETAEVSIPLEPIFYTPFSLSVLKCSVSLCYFTSTEKAERRTSSKHDVSREQRDVRESVPSASLRIRIQARFNDRCVAKKYTSFPTVVSIMTVELMLILRVLALYGNAKTMARLLTALYALQMMAWTILSILILVNVRPIPGKGLYSGCLYHAPPISGFGWLPALVFESILIFLTIHKSRKFGDFTPILKVLARDSVVYFLSITALLLFNVLYTSFGQKLLAPSLILPSSVLTSIAAARLTMNIRAFTMDEALATLATDGVHSMFRARTLEEVGLRTSATDMSNALAFGHDGRLRRSDRLEEEEEE